jgi:16S rRNA (cytidine1402-2'-O)-methyltransferase
MGGTLFLVATPIGNLEDLTHRACRVLGEVDALACEDTRVTRKVLDRYGIPRPPQMFACHDHNEARAAAGIVKLLAAGRSVALCTDAGSPGISDPGFRVVRAALEAGCRVEAVPGPSALVAALELSGLPTASFTFLGFPPRKPGPRRRLLRAEADRPHSLVLFESPHRLGALLADALAALGDRRAAVAIELTKMFEEVARDWLSALAERFAAETPRGEATVVIAGRHPKYTRPAPPERHGP